MKCTIRAWFVNHGIEIARGEKAWNTGRDFINSHRKPMAECGPDELWKAELDLELTQLDAITAQLEIVTKKLDAIGKNDPRIRRIKSIPGVGPRTAEILVACLDNPHRFKNAREVSAYFGLVPANTSPAKPIAMVASPSEAIHWLEPSWWSVHGHRFVTTLGARQSINESAANRDPAQEGGRGVGSKARRHRLGYVA